MLTGKRVLVVEDDQHVSEVIRATLEMQNSIVEISPDGTSGLSQGLNRDYDLLILDIMLPGKDGLEICRQLRQAGKISPIIMLTAKVEEIDKILGLELGADDYVTKPFSPRELVARCKAVIRRFAHSEQVRSRELRLPDLTLKREQYQASAHGEPLEFTPKEFELLVFFGDHNGQTLTREQILERVWGFDAAAGTRTIDEHVKRIRRKLEEAQVSSVQIKTVWGVGYQLQVLPNEG